MVRDRRLGRTLITASVGLLILSMVLLAYRADAWVGKRALDALLPAQGEAEGSLSSTGVIQARTIDLASEVGGRVLAVEVAEGEMVAEGQVLVRFDAALLDAQIAAAQAGVAVAEAALAQAEAGARPGQLAAARAAVAQAETALLVARQGVSDTLALLQEPQAIDLEIAGVRGELEATRHRLEAATALEVDQRIAKDHAEAMIDKYGPEGKDIQVPVGQGPDGRPIYREVHISVPVDAHLAHIPWWKTWVSINATQAQIEGLEAKLSHLYERRQKPQDLQVEYDKAVAAQDQAAAQLQAARAQLQRLERGATEEQLAALRARRDQAQEAVRTLQAQKERLTLIAPLAGTVLDLLAYPGEVVAPGAPLLKLANLSELTLTLYVPQGDIGRVNIGQPVEIRVDSFPGRIFMGRVTHITEEAQFTPRNVTTQEERATLVFAVTVLVPNEEGVLKPGMPADATFIEE
ncbi:MAG: efflux RND transporter periplasmic adaptor subunit [Chloroflexi bacterium]|nr:efflux RND transporter periplasmic adaptor subunit [Chloroflexota bacterium]